MGETFSKNIYIYVFVVENVLNLYGLVILIIISILICYGTISHYADINNGAYNQHVDEKEPFPLIVPKEFYVFYFLMTIFTVLPFVRSSPLR